MKGYTGKLMIQFTAKVRSLAERLIGAEFWDVPDLRALPGPVPLGYYDVQLCTVPNPDHGETSLPVPPE